MWERFMREARRSPRGVGVLLFAVALLIYGVAAGEIAATITGLVIVAVAVAIMVAPRA